MSYKKNAMQLIAHHFPHTIIVHLTNVPLLRATPPKKLKQIFFL